MSGYEDIEVEPVHVRLTPLFEARWSYEEFARVMPFGPDSEGQAYAYSRPSRVDGERLSGSYHLVQFPRARADGVLLPDVHGLIETESGDQVATRAGGYGIPVPGTGTRNVRHWMRLWTAAKDLAWLNSAVAFGVGAFVDDEACVRYWVAAPTREASEAPSDAPALELLGTARWEYEQYDTVRQFGDQEGVGLASSVGDVTGGVLAGRWRGCTTRPICETACARWKLTRRSAAPAVPSSIGTGGSRRPRRTNRMASSTTSSSMQLS